MAFPVILVNSATGSDTAASGAGPATALTGSAASTDGAGTVVTLDGSPDLSGVATDGSHAIYLADTTAGARNFGKITAKDNTAKTVTVSNAFGLSLSGKSWAIGGKRFNIGSTTSTKLFSNNSGSGDAMPGWIVEMESGHSETIAAAYVLRRAGDLTDGPIILRGTSGAATLPILTFSNNGIAIQPNAAYLIVRDFELRNSNATKTASEGIRQNAAVQGIQIVNIKIANSGSAFWKGIREQAAGGLSIRGCEIAYTAGIGIDRSATNGAPFIMNNYVHHCGSHGIATGQSPYGLIHGNLIVFNTGDGINLGATSTAIRTLMIAHNTIHGNAGDGIEITATTTDISVGTTWFLNNLITQNGGFGLNFSGASMTDAALQAFGIVITGNAHYGNSSGWLSGSLTIDTNTTNADPSGGLSSATKDYAGTTDGSNFAVGTAVKAKGYPVAGTKYIGTGSTTYSYVDPGAAQRQESGGGGVIGGGNLNGGFQ